VLFSLAGMEFVISGSLLFQKIKNDSLLLASLSGSSFSSNEMNCFRDFLAAYEQRDADEDLADGTFLEQNVQRLREVDLSFEELNHMHSDMSTGRLLLALVSSLKSSLNAPTISTLLHVLNNLCADPVVRDLLLEQLGSAKSTELIETVVEKIVEAEHSVHQFIQLLHNLTFRVHTNYPSLHIMELMPQLARNIESQDPDLLCPSLAALASCTRSNVAIKVCHEMISIAIFRLYHQY
jgi:hypothetical protein